MTCLQAALQPKFNDGLANPAFELGVTQYGSTDISSLEAVTALIEARSSWPLTIFNFDIEDKAFHDPVWQEFIRDNATPQGTSTQSILKANGFTTVSLSHGPAFTGSSVVELLSNGETGPGAPTPAGTPKNPPVVIYNPIKGMDVTIVGVPEIYDFAGYKSSANCATPACQFPPPFCPYASPNGKSNGGNCDGITAGTTTTIKIDHTVIDAGLKGWFNDCCDGIKDSEKSFGDSYSSASQTWPGFSVQRSCDDAKNGFTITGSPGSNGCSNFGYYELDDFLYFLQSFAIKTKSVRSVADQNKPVPVMLYEAAFISLAWMSTLGLTVLKD